MSASARATGGGGGDAAHNNTNYKAFVAAIRNHQYEKVKHLLEHNLDNQIDINNYIDDYSMKTPLCVACEMATTDARMVALLLEYGADPNKVKDEVEINGKCYDITKTSPLWLACRHDVSKGVLSHLLRYGADPNAIIRRDGWTILHLACFVADYDKINMLLDRTNVNTCDDCGESPIVHLLHLPFRSIDASQLSCLRLLLEHGADPNVVNQFGATPLSQLIFSGKGECKLDAIRLMMQHDADVTIPPHRSYRPGTKGDTILHAAVRLGDVDVIHAMCEKLPLSRFWSIRNDEDETVYDVAAELDATPIIAYFHTKLRQECYDHLRQQWIYKKPCQIIGVMSESNTSHRERRYRQNKQKNGMAEETFDIKQWSRCDTKRHVERKKPIDDNDDDTADSDDDVCGYVEEWQIDNDSLDDYRRRRRRNRYVDGGIGALYRSNSNEKYLRTREEKEEYGINRG